MRTSTSFHQNPRAENLDETRVKHDVWPITFQYLSNALTEQQKRLSTCSPFIEMFECSLSRALLNNVNGFPEIGKLSRVTNRTSTNNHAVVLSNNLNTKRGAVQSRIWEELPFCVEDTKNIVEKCLQLYTSSSIKLCRCCYKNL